MITAEIMKGSGDIITDWMHKICVYSWESGRVLDD